jgi:peptidoglycan/LPS O-acetylase OafA/YrhL
MAALLVCLEHWRKLFFVDYQAINTNPLLKVVYLLAGAGHQSVVIFFVLSGYLIGGSIFRSIESDDWSWLHYFMRRLARLWLVLIPALLLGAFWDILGLSIHRSPALYSGLISNHMSSDVHQSLTLRVFLGNASFLQTIVVPTFGSNGALWSLANEFWYYVLFPLILFVVITKYGHLARVILACGSVLIAFFVGAKILFSLPIWLIGVLLHRVPPAKVGVTLRKLACCVYLLLFFALCAADHNGGHIGKVYVPFLQGLMADYLLSLLTLMLLWVILSASQEAKDNTVVRAARSTARFSYTLYLAHTPILTFAASLLIRDTRWFPTSANIFGALSVFMVTLIYSWLLATVTEFKTVDVYRWFDQLIRKRGDKTQKYLATA